MFLKQGHVQQTFRFKLIYVQKSGFNWEENKQLTFFLYDSYLIIFKKVLFRVRYTITVRSGIRTHAYESRLRPERSALDHSAILNANYCQFLSNISFISLFLKWFDTENVKKAARRWYRIYRSNKPVSYFQIFPSFPVWVRYKIYFTQSLDLWNRGCTEGKISAIFLLQNTPF